MKRILSTIFIAFLSLTLGSGVAYAKENDNQGLRQAVSKLESRVGVLETTGGPKGDKGDTGATGATGPAGADGADGVTPWTDEGLGTVSTTGSIQIEDEDVVCDSTTAGTIRFTGADFEGCDGAAWVSLTYTGPIIYAIGDTGPAGGIVFYITDGGLSGLEAAPADQASGAPWGCQGTLIDGADGTAVGTGAQNTADILAGCGEAGTAAEIADAYTLNGYDDWFLHS